jgi:hypothetical protein
MKYFPALALAFALALSAPAAHAQSSCLPNTISTGSSCRSCPTSCVAGDTCITSTFTCQPVSGTAGGGPTTPPSGVPGGGPTTPGGTGGTQLLNPLSAGTSLPVLLQDILGFVVKIGAVAVVLMLVYVGFLFATAGGNESQISKAREALLWTIVGALILLGAQAIASGIQATAQALSTGT